MKNIKAKIVDLIRHDGPITIDKFMSYVVPYYYAYNIALGKDGDFTTAPEISQMFGEMIGVWCTTIWLGAGSPKFALAELGPGRGTLMSDLLRSTKNVPGFHESLQSINLIEISESLINTQQNTLSGFTDKIFWHKDLNGMPNIYTIYIANEFFDAMPVKQFKCEGGKIYEKLIGLVGEELVFIYSSKESETSYECVDGEVFETSLVSDQYAAKLADLIAKNNGAVVIIDYGYIANEKVETLQAVKQHKFHNILQDIGEADLTAHVNFKVLEERFKTVGLKTNIQTQAQFLLENGIMHRAAALSKKALPGEIEADMDRLLSSEHMGNLFKVLVVKK